MTWNQKLTSSFATLSVTFGLIMPLGAQSVNVEESTGTAPRQNSGEVIDIKLGSTAQPKPEIIIEAPGAPGNKRPQSKADINLTPSEFRPSANDSASTNSEAIPDSPAGIPVPTVVESATKTPTVPADEPSVLTKEPSPQKTPPKAASPADEINYLPAPGLDGETMLIRGDVQVPVRPESLKSAPFSATIPDVYETTLTNGIRFYHYESRDLPRIKIKLMIEAGGNADSADKLGIAELTQRTLRSGGSAGKSGDEIDLQLDQIGSELSLSSEREAISGSMFALSERADEAMTLLADIIQKPEFNEKKLEQQRASMLENLRRQNDEPMAVSQREFRKIIYGSDHILSRTPTTSSITAITRDDVRAFYDARYRPSTFWIGVSGDITRDDAKTLVEKHFGEWNRPEAEPLATAGFDSDRDSSSSIYLTKRPTAQSQIRIGHLGVPRMSPQAAAINVLNSVYGHGGFSSRLMNEVRTRHGYAYSTAGGVMSDEPVGLFTSIAMSKSASTVAATKEIISVMKSMIDNPPSGEELETAKRDVYFNFVSMFDTSNNILSTHMLYDYRGYPEDYLKTFPEKILAVTEEDVKKAALDFIHPERLKIYIIGNENSMDAPLSSLGDVTEWVVQNNN